MNFLLRGDYQRVVLYILTSVSVLLALKYLLPYFLPLLVALLIVVPLQRFCQRRKKSGQKGFMAGGILFGIILIAALIIVGIGTFLISKARILVQNADFWTNSIAQFITDLSIEIESFFQLQHGIVEQWLFERATELRECISKSGDGLLTGSMR